jgi:hypothetical protein
VSDSSSEDFRTVNRCFNRPINSKRISSQVAGMYLLSLGGRKRRRDLFVFGGLGVSVLQLKIVRSIIGANM